MRGLNHKYDELYTDGYRETLSVFDLARSRALRHLIKKVLKLNGVNAFLDYGCGSGIYVELWKNIFPEAKLHFYDISSVALDNLARKYPEYKDNCIATREGCTAQDNESFDVVVSIEVMEHVEDLGAFLTDIYRLLKPGGTFIWTTPCANPLSIEHIYSLLTGTIERTNEGYVRWKWEDPTHIRRLRTDQAEDIVLSAGFRDVGFRFRSHLFSFVCLKLFKGPMRKLCKGVVMWDYMLFRGIPNGAAMIGFAKK